MSPSEGLLAIAKMRLTTFTPQRKLTLKQPYPVQFLWDRSPKQPPEVMLQGVPLSYAVGPLTQRVRGPLRTPMVHQGKLTVGMGRGQVVSCSGEDLCWIGQGAGREGGGKGWIGMTVHLAPFSSLDPPPDVPWT